MKLRIRETYDYLSGIFYKNVDICDLPSIMSKGILSLDDSGNNNWDSGKRAKNATNAVYLFRPTGYENSFVNYGAALLEVEVSGKENEMVAQDVNKGKYIEYICDYVSPDDIKAIYIPKIFKNKVRYRHPKIKWVDMEAKIFSSDLYYANLNKYGKKGFLGITQFDDNFDKKLNYADCDEDMLQLFTDTSEIYDSTDDMYFRGILPNGEIFDLYYIHYDI